MDRVDPARMGDDDLLTAVRLAYGWDEDGADEEDHEAFVAWKRECGSELERRGVTPDTIGR